MALSACPVCPFEALAARDLARPSCGTDLTVLRRVQELLLVVLNDAIRLARGGNLVGVRRRCEAAARCELRAGRLWAGVRAWREPRSEARVDAESAALAAAMVRPPGWRRRR